VQRIKFKPDVGPVVKATNQTDNLRLEKEPVLPISYEIDETSVLGWRLK
jgi:hypothetical protein